VNQENMRSFGLLFVAAMLASLVQVQSFGLPSFGFLAKDAVINLLYGRRLLAETKDDSNRNDNNKNSNGNKKMNEKGGDKDKGWLKGKKTRAPTSTPCPTTSQSMAPSPMSFLEPTTLPSVAPSPAPSFEPTLGTCRFLRITKPMPEMSISAKCRLLTTAGTRMLHSTTASIRLWARPALWVVFRLSLQGLEAKLLA
jgi:hypothetical protein